MQADLRLCLVKIQPAVKYKMFEAIVDAKALDTTDIKCIARMLKKLRISKGDYLNVINEQ